MFTKHLILCNFFHNKENKGKIGFKMLCWVHIKNDMVYEKIARVFSYFSSQRVVGSVFLSFSVTMEVHLVLKGAGKKNPYMFSCGPSSTHLLLGKFFLHSTLFKPTPYTLSNFQKYSFF